MFSSFQSIYSPHILNLNLYSGIEDEVRNEVAKQFKIDPKNLSCKIKTVFLPTIYFFKKIGGKIYVEVGKILGAYSPLKKEIYIDTLLYLRSFFDSAALRQYIRVLAQEFAHRAQHYLGKLKPKNPFDYLTNYHKDENEIEAKGVEEKVSNIIFNRYNL